MTGTESKFFRYFYFKSQNTTFRRNLFRSFGGEICRPADTIHNCAFILCTWYKERTSRREIKATNYAIIIFRIHVIYPESIFESLNLLAFRKKTD